METNTPNLDLQAISKIAKDIKAKKTYNEMGEFADDFSPLIFPHLVEFFNALIEKDGIPSDYTGYTFPIIPFGVAEILLCHLEEGRYYPSVSSDWYEAKISSVDTSEPDLGTKDPSEALAMGFDDLLCNLFGADIEKE
jgi:hypothetical protein